MGKPILHYFELRGRGEPIRLALAYAQAAGKIEGWEFKPVDYAGMKADRETYPFGQCPRLEDGDLSICQSNTIFRYIARKYGLDGPTEKEQIDVDMVNEGVESLRLKYLSLVYQDQLGEGAKSTFAATHILKEGLGGRNSGAHLDYLEAFLRKGNGKVTSAPLTLADINLWEMTDLLLRIFEDQVKANYPTLMEFYAHVAEMPGIKEYLASPLRLAKINGNGLG